MKKICVKFDDSVGKFKGSVDKGILAAIGNFDGIHTGHQKLISEAKSEAKKKNLPFSIITFTPHPRDFFSKQKDNFKIADELEKQRLIKTFDVDYYITITFDNNLRKLEPKEFIKTILKELLNVKIIFAGQNFRFGKDRSGSLSDSYKIFKEFGIQPVISNLLKKDQDVISSEVIRKNICVGDFEQIKNLLGRKWAITGNVEHGEKNGSKIGFPTANLYLSEIIHPRFGVYVTNTFIMTDDGQNFISKSFPSVTNFGIRPTVDGKQIIFETHILNTSNLEVDLNLYDKRIYVEIGSYLRQELKFASFSDLKRQIKKDVEAAKFKHEKNK